MIQYIKKSSYKQGLLNYLIDFDPHRSSDATSFSYYSEL